MSSLAPVVLKIAELGSAARAARVLGVTQQSASLACRQLEHDAGVRLLEREGSVLRATPAGAEYLASLLPHAATRVADSPAVAVLHVDVCASELGSLVLPALPCFTAFRRGLELRLRTSASDLRPWPPFLAAALRTGATWLAREGSEVIAAYPQVACAAKSYVAAHGAPVEECDIGEHVFVQDLEAAEHAPDPLHAAPRPTAERGSLGGVSLASDDVDVRLTAALAARAVAVLPLNPSVRAHLARGALVQVLQAVTFPALPIVLMRAACAPRQLEDFARWLRALYVSECLHADELLERAPASRRMR